jgi:hypothetical protein
LAEATQSLRKSATYSISCLREPQFAVAAPRLANVQVVDDPIKCKADDVNRVILAALSFALWMAPPANHAFGQVASSTDTAKAVSERLAKEMRARLGAKAGEPERPDDFVVIPVSGRPLTRSEARPAFRIANERIERERWWRIELDPAKTDRPLREPASVISGCVAAYRAGLEDGSRSLTIAIEAAAFLIWAQQQAGTGLFPFPSARTGRSRAMQAARVRLNRAEREGRLEAILRNGWVIEDLDDGGLQFDNGEAGTAMFALYEVTLDPRHLASARRAAEWAINRPVVANWNYNSFSAHLLAKAYSVTGEKHYLDAAAAKALAGVIPGQLTDGPNAGRWIDPHNAQASYHYIMLRALAAVAAALPEQDVRRPALINSLVLGLRARNRDFVNGRATNKNSAMDALITANRLFAQDTAFLRDTLSAEALEKLGLLVAAQYRRGAAPLDPREWGMFLAHIVGK